MKEITFVSLLAVSMFAGLGAWIALICIQEIYFSITKKKRRG